MTELRRSEPRGKVAVGPTFGQKPQILATFYIQDINFKLSLPITYLINDGQTNFEVNWTLFHHLSP